MLQALVDAESCREVSYMETTITRDNKASWALFHKLAESLEAPVHDSVLFDKEIHFGGQHDSEMLVRIGPFSH